MGKGLAQLPRGIRMRGDKFFVDVSVKGARKTATCDTLEDASDKRQALLDALNGVLPSSAPRVSWTLHRAWLVTSETAQPVGWHGSRGYSKTAKNGWAAVEYFGKERTLDSITYMDLEAYARYLEEHKRNSGPTVNRKMAALSKMWKVAVRNHGAEVRPDIPRRKEPKGRCRVFTEHEEAMILNTLRAWNQDDMADLVIVLIETGMRCGECLKVTSRDVDLKRREVHLTPDMTKREDTRTVPLSQRAHKVFMRRLGAQPLGRVFPGSYPSYNSQWDRVRDHLNMSDDKDWVLHSLRHTFASRVLQRPRPDGTFVDLYTLMRLMGHTSFETTKRYAHLSTGHLHDAISVLD